MLRILSNSQKNLEGKAFDFQNLTKGGAQDETPILG